MDSITPGPRDHLITRALERALAALDPDLLVSNDLDNAEAPERLSRHLMTEVRRELTGRESADAQAADLNRLLGKALPTGDAGDAEIVLPARILQGIRDRSPLGDPLDLPPAPATPLGQSDLLVNAEGQPNIGAELRSELASADSVDLICAFVIWSGVRHLRDALAEVVDRGLSATPRRSPTTSSSPSSSYGTSSASRTSTATVAAGRSFDVRRGRRYPMRPIQSWSRVRWGLWGGYCMSTTRSALRSTARSWRETTHPRSTRSESASGGS